METAIPRDWSELHKALRAQGWTIEPTSNGHHKTRGPKGGLVHFSDSGDPRAILNTMSELKKNGFVWPPPENGGAPPLPPELCPVCRRLTWDAARGECSSCHEVEFRPPQLGAKDVPRLVQILSIPAPETEKVEPTLPSTPNPLPEPKGRDDLDYLLDEVRAAKALLAEVADKRNMLAAKLAAVQADFETADRLMHEMAAHFNDAKKKLVEGLDSC